MNSAALKKKKKKKREKKVRILVKTQTLILFKGSMWHYFLKLLILQHYIDSTWVAFNAGSLSAKQQNSSVSKHVLNIHRNRKSY